MLYQLFYLYNIPICCWFWLRVLSLVILGACAANEVSFGYLTTFVSSVVSQDGLFGWIGALTITYAEQFYVAILIGWCKKKSITAGAGNF